MADYKRMISYMYQYENGIKRRNVGFARVEAKNGQCKITLHMQLLGQSDSIFPTYLIHREENRLELIYLGDSILKNQVMDSRLTADESNIMGSGYSLSDMGGLLIFLNNNIFFATGWDEKPIDAKDVLEAMKPKPKKNKDSKEINNNDSKGIKDKKDLPGKINEPEVIIKAEPTVAINNVPEQLSLEEELRIPKYKLPRGWKTVEMFQKPLAAAESSHRRNMFNTAGRGQLQQPVQEEVHSVQEQQQSIKPLQNQHQNVQPQQEEQENRYQQKDTPQEGSRQNNRQGDYRQSLGSGLGERQPNRRPQQRGLWQTRRPGQVDYRQQALRSGQEDDQLPGRPSQEDIKQLDRRPEVNRELEQYQEEIINRMEASEEGIMAAAITMDTDQEDPPVAKHFLDSNTRIYPFEDNEILLCVKIEPKEIGLLPKELWALSNNSFLMHGYYCYHHLIFAKKKDGESYCYILGIPGIYHNREQFMARMFGFESFKSIRKRDLRQGDFGYWYLPVKF